MAKRKSKFNDNWTKEYGFVSINRKDNFHVILHNCCDIKIGNEEKSAQEINRKLTAVLLVKLVLEL